MRKNDEIVTAQFRKQMITDHDVSSPPCDAPAQPKPTEMVQRNVCRK